MRFASFLIIIAFLPTLPLVAEPATKPTTKPAEGVLSKKLVELRLKNVALADVLSFMNDVTGASVTVTANWKELATAQVDKNVPITLEVKNKTLGEVIDMILLQLGPEKNLTYVVVGNTVEITTKAAAEHK